MQFLNYNKFVLNETLKYSYLLNIDWWSLWKEKNKDVYKISLNAIDKTYEVYDLNNNIIFVYDYNKQRVFSNKQGSFFKIKNVDMTPTELADVIDKEKQAIDPPQTDKNKPTETEEE